MRPVKQLGVVTTHSINFFAPYGALGAGAALLLLHVTREAFLFISACMLTYSYSSLNKGNLKRYYHRRLVSVGVPYVAWTFIYFMVTRSASRGIAASLAHFGVLLLVGYEQLYYLVVLVQFYLVYPLFLRLLRALDRHHWAVIAWSALLQVALMSVMHWKLVPSWMQGRGAIREIFSYQFYLVAGSIAALHYEEFHAWLVQHKRLVLLSLLGATVLAETWFSIGALGLAPWMGSPSDAFQPVVIPFNVAAIAAIYLLGVDLVGEKRSGFVRSVTKWGSDGSYGVYLAQYLVIMMMSWAGWSRLREVFPWPVVVALAVPLVFLSTATMSSLAARTPLARPLAGRDWLKPGSEGWLPRLVPSRLRSADSSTRTEVVGA